MSFHDHRARLLGSTFLALETKDAGGSGGDEPNVEQAVADLTAAFETKMADLDRQMKAQKDRADALEVKLGRPGAAGDDGPSAETKAFEGYVRRGRESLWPDEVKTLRVADDQAGGFLAPPQLELTIVKALLQFSPIRQIASVRTMSAPSVKLPRLTKRIAAQWVSEIEERPEDEPRFGQTEIAAHEMAVSVPVSNQLLEDSSVNLEAELQTEFGEAFGLLEGEAFLNGTGDKQPVGLMVDPSIPIVPNGHATDIKPEGLLAIMYSLPAFYRNRGTWVLNGPTIGKIRGLKDTTGRFLWADSMTEGEPPRLLGRPVVEAVDMPDADAQATPIVFGDIGTAYQIRDRVGLSVLRDPYSRAKFGQTMFHARRRVGGAVIQPEAVRKLKMAVS